MNDMQELTLEEIEELKSKWAAILEMAKTPISEQDTQELKSALLRIKDALTQSGYVLQDGEWKYDDLAHDVAKAKSMYKKAMARKWERDFGLKPKR